MLKIFRHLSSPWYIRRPLNRPKLYRTVLAFLLLSSNLPQIIIHVSEIRAKNSLQSSPNFFQTCYKFITYFFQNYSSRFSLNFPLSYF